MAKMILKKYAHIDKVVVQLRKRGIVVKRKMAKRIYVIHAKPGTRLELTDLMEVKNEEH